MQHTTPHNMTGFTKNFDRANGSIRRSIVVLALSVPCLVGCSAISNLVTKGFDSPPEVSVPTRTSVNAAATPVPTSTLAASAPNGADGVSANATSAPLTMPGASAGATRRSGGLLSMNNDTSRANDNGLTEGGGNISQVSFAAEGGDYAPDVDRTGTFMVFASTQHRPTFDIYRKSVDGRTVTQLTTDPSDDLMPAIAPDGKKIVFTTVVNPDGNSEWPEQSDIWVVNADGTGRVGLTNSRFRNMQPAWGADGRVYFVSNRGGLENIWAIAVDGARNGTGSAEFAANASKKAKKDAELPATPAAVVKDMTPDLLKADKVATVPD